MFRNVFIILFLIFITSASAVADFYPQTMIAEDFSTSTCTTCDDAYDGLDVLHGNHHNGEFLSARFYTNSINLSNPDTEARFPHYNVSLTPTVIFNGTLAITGGGENIVNGSAYTTALKTKLYAQSPVKMSITGFNAATGQVSARVTMLSGDYTISNQTLSFFLMENSIMPSATKVVRAVLSQPISITGANTMLDFNATFTVLPAWNAANMWVAAVIQLSDRSIIQAASNLPQPAYQIRATMPFNTYIIDDPNYNYISQPIHFYNTGAAENFTIKLLKDDGPNDWYLNYCSENGECYPGFVAHPFTLAAGDTVGFHLNLSIGSSGISNFHFLVESPNMEPYIIPFTYQTSDTPNQDFNLPEVNIGILPCYPNPFYQSTTLRLLAKQIVNNSRIEIFNSKGQKVHTLQTGDLKKGLNEIGWNGTDQFGRKLPIGIYYYKLAETDSPAIGKMLLINK